MKGTSDIIMSLHHINMAKQHLESFLREKSNTAIGRILRAYLNKVNWMLTDIQTNPVLSDKTREAVTREMKADSYSVPALTDKIGLLNAELRERLEDIIDRVLAGEELQITE